MGRNVKRRAKKINDGVMSLYTWLGKNVDAISYKDVRKIRFKELMNMYESSWIVRKYIDKTAKDMLKKRREFSGDISEELKTQIEDTENELDVYQAYEDALSWASLMGDSLIIAITDCVDEAIVEPLNLDTENICRFLVLNPTEYKPSREVNLDISSNDFLMPEFFTVTVNSSEIKFHHSRCHRTKPGKHSLKDVSSYGTSDVQAAYRAIKIFDTAVTSTGDTIQEANVDVMFLSDLYKKIAAGQEEEIRKYVEVVKRSKSATNILLIDAGEDGNPSRYEQKTAQFSGLSDVIVKLASVLSGALDRPITVLFGQSASGFNSGEEDNRSYYETINSLQESRLRPMQNFVDQFILDKLALNEIDKIAFEYPSIDSINDEEEATRFGQYSTGFASLVEKGIVEEHIALREMVARGVLATVTDEEIELIKGVSNDAENYINTEAGGT